MSFTGPCDTALGCEREAHLRERLLQVTGSNHYCAALGDLSAAGEGPGLPVLHIDCADELPAFKADEGEP